MTLKDTIQEICSYNGWAKLVPEVETVYLNQFDEKEIYDPKFEPLVELNWSRAIKSAEEKKIKPHFNGKIARFLGLTEVFRSCIGLNLGVTDFKHYVGMRTGTDPRIFAFCVGAVTFYRDIANEKHFCFARRSKDALDAGGSIETFPAGFSNVDNFYNKRGRGNSEILESEIKREFEEELGAPKECIKSIETLGITKMGDYIDPITGRSQTFNYVALDYLIELDTNESELNGYFKKDNEHSEMFIIPESKLEEFIKQINGGLVLKSKQNMLYLLERGLLR